MQMVKNIGPTQTFILIPLQCLIASQSQKKKANGNRNTIHKIILQYRLIKPGASE